MGIFDFFKKSSQAQSPLYGEMAKYNHKRFYERFQINDRDLCTVDQSRHGFFRVIDISHHGCLVESVADSSFENATLPCLVTLSVCGATLNIEVAQFQKRKNGWALIFNHAHEPSILRIGEFIEPLRLGNSAIELAARDDSLRVSNQVKFIKKRFQGDGPLDLIYETTNLGAPKFIMITSRSGGEYNSVTWDRGNVQTKMTIDGHGESARMAQLLEVDRKMVWRASVCCLGLKYREGIICAQTLAQWLKTAEPSE